MKKYGDYVWSRISMVIVIVVNMVYGIYCLSYFIIKDDTFFIKNSISVIELIIVIIPILIGYIIYSFSSTRIAQNTARTLLDLIPEFYMLADDIVNKDNLNKDKIELYKKEVNNELSKIFASDGMSRYIVFNYYIIFIVIVVMILFDNCETNIVVYSLLNSLFLSFVSIVSYFIVKMSKKNINKRIIAIS